MNILKHSLTKIALGAVTLLVVATLYAPNASASRYAIAYLDGSTGCGTTPGDPCAKT